MRKTIINRLLNTTFHTKNKGEIKKLAISALITLFSIMLFSFIFKNLKSATNFKLNNKELFIQLSFIFQWFAILTPYILLKKGIRNTRHEAFCIKKQNIIETSKDVTKGFFIYFTSITIAILIIIFGGIEIPGFQAQEQILTQFGTETLNLIIAGFMIVIIGPILEEIVFRGIILKKLTTISGTKLGSVVTAIIFALLHMQIETFIPLFILGLILNHMTIKRKSITSAITFHIINNGIVFSIQLMILLDIINIEQIIS